MIEKLKKIAEGKKTLRNLNETDKVGYESRLTIFFNCPIKENYKIDNITSFINTYPNQLRFTFDWGRFIDISSDTVNYTVPNGPYDYREFNSANYAKIETRKVTYTKNEAGKYTRSEELLPEVYYYFIQSIDITTVNSCTFLLVMDVLNSFDIDNDIQNRDYSFSPLTFVIREHIDRFLVNSDNLAPVTIDDRVYMLRNIKDSQINEILKDFDSYPLYYKNDNYEKNYWIKIILRTTEGVYSCYIPRFNSIKLKLGSNYYDLHSLQYYADTTVNNRTLLEILQGSEFIENISPVPYPPHNLYTEEPIEQPDVYGIPEMFEFNVFSIEKPDEGVYSFNFLRTTFSKYLNQHTSDNLNFNGYVPLEKTKSPKNNEKYYFSNVLKNSLVASISTNDFNKLRNGETLLNGVFAGNRVNFYDVNESGVLTSGLTSLSLDYNNAQFNIILENYKFDKEKNLRDFLEQEVNGFKLYYVNFYGLNLGCGFKFKCSDYFKNLHNSDVFLKVENLSLPQTTSNYFKDFRESQDNKNAFDDSKKIEDKIKDLKDELNKPWYARFMDANRYMFGLIGGKINEYTKNTSIGSIGRTVYSALRGNWLLAGIRLMSMIVSGRENQNEQSSQTITTIDNVFLINPELKLNLEIKQAQNIETHERQYYLTGNEVNEYKIPTHNNRKYFDYLQCSPVFATMRLSKNWENLIKEKYESGIYFIHQIKSEWIFPEENPENIEISVIS